MTDFTVIDATALQRDAADPTAPRMVNANAGSGKTKVLVDRVSRILLLGTDPDKILCLTYTRAAASEMQTRLFETFSRWSISSDASLKSSLSDLYGVPFDAIRPALDLNNVRTLFASALETPEGLKVMTIHAFCERIIARFPIEAGLMPGFSPLDEPEAAALLAESRTRLLVAAQTDKGLANALHLMARVSADQTIDDLLFGAARNFETLDHWKQSGGLRGFRGAAGLDPEETVESLLRAAWAQTDKTRLKSIAALCQGKGKTAESFAATVNQALAADETEAFRIYAGAFFTQSGSLRRSILVKAVTNIDAFITSDSAETARIVAVMDRVKALRLAERSEAYLTLGHWLGADYQRAKHAARGLDFNDLILKTRELLTRTDVSDWVAYKLDGGVDHVLLDEAQDTSPQQWEIIDALTAPFRQDSPDRDGPARTFFAVGDPKQSIYRFQGAAPKLFMESIRHRAEDGKGVNLRMSFRSAQSVLDVVDALFIDQKGLQAVFDPDLVPEASDQIRHVAFRDDVGLVECWPLVPRAGDVEESEPWDTTPVDAMGDTEPKVRLAREIASTIRTWIKNGESIFDRDLKDVRPIQAGDILILVQKRVGGLFDAIIRELKRAGLPVAGADRLVLQEATIVRDLLSLTRFVLLPSDCLSLGEVLKSPLFGLDDRQLFELCVDRERQSLWQSVQKRAPELASALRVIKADAGGMPYEFYAKVLDHMGPHGMSYREALLQRLGLESREALDAFLAHALAHQQRRATSLQHFLHAFTANDIEIKRDKDPAGRDVRVMTVHGAKGLEAPIVFMPDTTRAPTKKVSGLIAADDSFILAPSSADSIPLTDRYRDAYFAEEMREYMRLLYVAMTRAESRLIVCGAWHGRNDHGYVAGSWYDWVRQTMTTLETSTFQTRFDDDDKMGLRYGSAAPKAMTAEIDASPIPSILPDWIGRPAPSERRRNETTSPSALLARSTPYDGSPGQETAFRGVLIHRLLEILPDHPLSRRAEIADAMLRRYKSLSGSDRMEIQDQVFSVLDHPDFAAVFAKGSRAEVSLAGRVKTIRDGDVFMTAQIDRLSITSDTLYLVDYKSTSNPPDTEADVDIAYVAQMAAYRELAKAVWPDLTIRCGLLWTAIPHLMWLQDNAMEAALTQVNALPTSMIG